MAKLVLEGRVILHEQEGGFCAAAIEIAESEDPTVRLSLDRHLLIWAHGELPESDRGGSVDDGDCGNLRITIERIE